MAHPAMPSNPDVIRQGQSVGQRHQMLARFLLETTERDQRIRKSRPNCRVVPVMAVA